MLTEWIVRRFLDRIPCGRCSAPGPHFFFEWEIGGTTAFCDTCRAELRHEAFQDRADSLHPSSNVAGSR